MCFDEKTSWITFTLGSAINLFILVYLYKEYTESHRQDAYIAFVSILVWQYALLMQIPDGLAWNALRSKSKTPQSIGKLAYMLNILQPVVAMIGLCYMYTLLKISKTVLIPLFACLVVYLVFMLTYLKTESDFNIAPIDSCSSLNYKWWTAEKGIVYLIIFIVILLFVPGLKWKIANIAIFLVSFLVMSLFYRECNVSSLWCWSIAPAGLILLLVYLGTKG